MPVNIPALGPLTPDSKIPAWLVSAPISVPFFDGQRLTFTLDGLEESDTSDVIVAIRAFLALGAETRTAATPYIFANYRRIAELVSADDLGCEIASPQEVWAHIQPSEIFVSRRHRRDQAIYVQITAECDWEPEHGLQIVFRRGHELVRVSEQDGHLTHADAFNLPESEDKIVEGPIQSARPPDRPAKPWWRFWYS